MTIIKEKIKGPAKSNRLFLNTHFKETVMNIHYLKGWVTESKLEYVLTKG